MSLTGILRRPRVRLNLGTWFRQHYPNPRPELIRIPKVKLKSSQAPYPGEIGMAFDYLFRFHLEQKFPEFVKSRKSWVAEHGFRAIIQSIESSDKKYIKIGANGERRVVREKFKQKIEMSLSEAKDRYNRFLKTGVLTKELVESTVFLARLESKFRSGITDKRLDKSSSEHVVEILDLISIVPWESFRPKKHCILNPDFGDGSVLVRGADADMIIDGKLIDLKTSKKLGLSQADVNQQIGYYLLSKIGGVNGKMSPKINSIGIYYARTGELWVAKVKDFGKDAAKSERAEEFKAQIEDWKLNLFPDLHKTSEGVSRSQVSYEIDPCDFKCPHCESYEFIRGGKRTGGKHRYKCKDCNRTFTTLIDTDYNSERLKRFVASNPFGDIESVNENM